MNIGLGKSKLKVFQKGILNSISDIYNIYRFKENLTNEKGYGEIYANYSILLKILKITVLINSFMVQ